MWSATRIKVENQFDRIFSKPDSPIRGSRRPIFVETRLGGVGTFDISLISENEDAFKEPAKSDGDRKEYSNFSARCKAVDKSLSFADLLKDMNESFHNENSAFYKIPESREMVAQYLLLYDSEEIEDFVSAAYDRARISVRISEHGSLRQKRDDRRATGVHSATWTRNNLAIRVTGRIVNDINIVDDLVRGQMLSLGLASLIISLVMLFVFKSWAMALVAMIPKFFADHCQFRNHGACRYNLWTQAPL